MENQTPSQSIDGFYKVEFGTPLGTGYGVASLSDGALRGGDSSMFYAGSYQVSEGKFTATIEIGSHSIVPGMTSVLGTNEATLNVTGNVGGNRIQGSGTSIQAPGITLQVILTRLME